MSVKALFFDLDGLLLDTEKIYLYCWIEAANALGYKLDASNALRLRSCDSELAKEIIKESFQGQDLFNQLRAKRKEIMANYTQVQPIEIKNGVQVFFESGILNKYNKYIVTSSIPGDKLTVLERAGVLAKIDRVITTKQVARGKPYPDVYLFAMHEAGVSKDECIAFEDSPNGVISASDAGCKVIMVPDLTQPSDDLRSRCAYVLPKLSDALSVLQSDGYFINQ